jgi:hypothetical protein
MESYCSERQVGAALTSLLEPDCKSVELPAAVLDSRIEIDGSKTGSPWANRDRDIACEVVVPISVLESLGKDVYAGRPVSISCSTSPDVQHIARIIPLDLCKKPHMSSTVKDALDVDMASCTAGGKPTALISPMLAFNLGIPYQMAQLMEPEEFKRWFQKKSIITIATIGASWPDDRDDIKTASPWAPGCASGLMHAATHVALAHCARPEKVPPFNIIDFQDNLTAAAAAMQGMAEEKDEDELQDDDVDELSKQQHEQWESDTMKVCWSQSYPPHSQVTTNRPRLGTRTLQADQS